MGSANGGQRPGSDKLEAGHGLQPPGGGWKRREGSRSRGPPRLASRCGDRQELVGQVGGTTIRMIARRAYKGKGQ